MRVLTRADYYCIEGFGVVEELSEIGEFARLWVFRRRRVHRPRIHVAQSDNIFRGNGFEIAGATAAGTDDGDVEFIIEVLAPEESGGGCNGAHRAEHRSGELATVELIGFHRYTEMLGRSRLSVDSQELHISDGKAKGSFSGRD